MDRLRTARHVPVLVGTVADTRLAPDCRLREGDPPGASPGARAVTAAATAVAVSRSPTTCPAWSPCGTQRILAVRCWRLRRMSGGHSRSRSRRASSTWPEWRECWRPACWTARDDRRRPLRRRAHRTGSVRGELPALHGSASPERARVPPPCRPALARPTKRNRPPRPRRQRSGASTAPIGSPFSYSPHGSAVVRPGGQPDRQGAGKAPLRPRVKHQAPAHAVTSVLQPSGLRPVKQVHGRWGHLGIY